MIGKIRSLLLALNRWIVFIQSRKITLLPTQNDSSAAIATPIVKVVFPQTSDINILMLF